MFHVKHYKEIFKIKWVDRQCRNLCCTCDYIADCYNNLITEYCEKCAIEDSVTDCETCIHYNCDYRK